MSLDHKLVADLRQRREAIRLGGGAEKMTARRGKGLMNARERIDALCQHTPFRKPALMCVPALRPWRQMAWWSVPATSMAVWSRS